MTKRIMPSPSQFSPAALSSTRDRVALATGWPATFCPDYSPSPQARSLGSCSIRCSRRALSDPIPIKKKAPEEDGELPRSGSCAVFCVLGAKVR